MSSYYYDERGIIREELIDSKAKDIAQKLVFSRVGKDDKETKTQIRKFYNEVKLLEKRLKDRKDSPDKEAEFLKILPLIKMIKAKVAYAVGRENAKISQSFKDFLFKSIDEIKDKEDFEAFVLHFESVIGYYYEQAKLAKEGKSRRN